VIRRIAVALLVAGALPAGAQIGRGQRQALGTDPDYWVGLSYGYVSGTTITDDASSTIWQFGYTSQIRATIEKTVQRGFTIGAAAGFATAPLTYSSSTFSGPANANVTQYMGFLRGGGGAGFHGIYSLELGMTQFSKFRARDGDTSLAPVDAKNDFSFGLGLGFGYGFSRTSEVYVAEQSDWVLHRQGSTTNANAPRISTFNGGIRIGF
jgi:hypothetical protein